MLDGTSTGTCNDVRPFLIMDDAEDLPVVMVDIPRSMD